MSKGIDIVPLIEWAIKRNPPAPPERTPRKKELSLSNIDIPALIMAERQRAEGFMAMLKDFEKLGKKEEKPKDKSWWDKITTPQLAMMMLVLVPVYVVALQKLLH